MNSEAAGKSSVARLGTHAREACDSLASAASTTKSRINAPATGNVRHSREIVAAKKKAVVVHRGARDGYHVARALAEQGLLEKVVTDLYWPGGRFWLKGTGSNSPASLFTTKTVSTCWKSGIIAHSIAKLLPTSSLKRRSLLWSDRCLGGYAGKLAAVHGAAILSYSHAAYSAFSSYSGSGPRILFQLTPHPARVREILSTERDLHPDCELSLSRELELALPADAFERLTAETRMADYSIAASSFTRDTLIGGGASGERVYVIPYGVDLHRFPVKPFSTTDTKPLQLLFVGPISQRRGFKYLLQALSSLPKDRVRLLALSRPGDDLSLVRAYGDRFDVVPMAGEDGLMTACQRSDVFVLPALAEGFGSGLLEAMASGLPVISTLRTAAADLIRPGIEGFLARPGSASSLAEAIEQFLIYPGRVKSMGKAARQRAEEFSWETFRSRVGKLARHLMEDIR